MGEAYPVAVGHLNVANDQIHGVTERFHDLEGSRPAVRFQRLKALPVSEEDCDIRPDGRIVIDDKT